ncbi:helix-turn-helix domain-containing protein [Methylobacterium sp. J-077]|uniref:AraC-like ligand-binding domain-containing protein n=1 Tax=Methylobacterium sp. J-077 TaxID=2836656 RepID=UPI001FB927F9|nr:helix-turn-helix domain-containing protein [Methylobacterium sp. J-077]MCJ2125235.1 helix-turn-helix domain-containing protein [Methylobacterium sp. J-077]
MQSKSILEMGGDEPGLHQAASWREAVAPFWDFSIRQEDIADFRGRSQVRHLGNAVLCRASASSLRFERPRALVARMGVDHILAHVRVSGRSRIAIDGSERDCGPGDICLFDLSRPLAARSTDYRALTLVLPRPLFGAEAGDLDALHGTVLQGATPFGRLLADHLRALSAHADGFSEREARAAAAAAATLIAAAVPRLSGGDRTGQAPERAPLLVAMRRVIEAELATPGLTAEALCGRFGVSRSALYRLFAPMGGVAGYIRQRRLDRAYQELARAGEGRPARISEVAYRWHFETPAHFTQAFRDAFGCPPRDVRAQARAGAPPSPLPLRQDWADFYDWILRLSA